MTGKNARQNAFLRLVSGNSAAFGTESRYLLLTTQEVVIGRDPNCQVILDAIMCRMVSRRHAVVRSLSSSPDGEEGWIICDLNSANGTYLNRKRLQGCQQLIAGDRITLGQDGPELIFEYELNQQPTVLTQAVLAPLPPANNYQTPISTANYQSPPSSDYLSFTQLFPIISTGKDLTRKAYLIPGIITVVFVVLMFATIERPQINQIIVATFIALAAYYFFIYLLCGKHKPWWVLLASALTTMLILLSPILDLFFFVFRVILPGSLPANQESITFTELLLRMFFGAGLMEELLKALPILGAHIIARALPSPWRERVGVWEPLDGILLGTASAVGFTLLETLGQYVPQFAQTVAQTGMGDGLFAGFRLLIPRILGSLPGHMAYSGYLGYFIGLAVLKPTKSWQILLVGYLTAAGLHALWNAAGVINGFLLVVVGVLSYAFLMAAILKARALSPTRSQNFATRFLGPK